MQFAGSDTLNPWGCVQLYCCRKARLRLRELILETPMQSPSLDLSTVLNTLQSRLDTVELLLNEYVVNQTHLESINKNQTSSIFGKLLPWRNKN